MALTTHVKDRTEPLPGVKGPKKRRTKAQRANETELPPRPGDEEEAETILVTDPDDDPSKDDWMWLGRFTDADWANSLVAYLWRTYPITDRANGGKPTSVEQFRRRFDLDTIMKAHGSGGYRLDIVRIDRDSGQYSRIRQFYFFIRNMLYPPQIPAGDWVDDPRNKEWSWGADAQAQTQHQNGKVPVVDESRLFNTILDGVERLQGKRDEGLAGAVLGLVKDSQQQIRELSDPSKQLGMLRDLIAAVRPQEAPSNGESTQMMMFRMMEAQLSRQHAEIMAMRSQPSKSLVEQLVEAAPALQTIAKTFGWSGGKSSAGSDWTDVVKEVVGEVGKHVPDFLEAWKMKVMHENGGGLAGLKKKPATTTQTTPPQVNAAPSAEGTEEEKRQQRQQFVVEKYGQLIQTVAPFMVDHFKAELTGQEFRDWFLSRYGFLQWTGLRDEAGVQTLVELTQLHPMLKAACAPVEKFTAFMQGFFEQPTDPQQQPPEDEEDETPRNPEILPR